MQTKTVSNDELIRQLRWRYATKKFDGTRTIPDDDWRTLEEALVLTPSSFGLQPWKFIVIRDPELRSRLVSATWNQAQIVQASHVVVFATPREFGIDYIDRLIQRTAEVRSSPTASLSTYRKMMVDSLLTAEALPTLSDWCIRQAYIALGSFMTSAALLGIDTCPIEGFEPAQYNAALNLTSQNLSARVVCAAGYRDPDDKYAALAKVRYPVDQVIERR